MTDISFCPYCNDILTACNDMYICGGAEHSFVFFPETKKFGLVADLNTDKLSANNKSISINGINYAVSKDYNISNCKETLMNYYKRFNSNRAFS
jgi:hypothetical protein